MSNEQKYLYWCPGMEQPDDLSGWCVLTNDGDYESREEHREGKHLVFHTRYRKACTDAEYRAHHAAEIDSTFESDAERRAFYGMRMWPCDCPKGYRVVDFRKPTSDDNLVLTQYGDVVSCHDHSISVVCPILEKIKPVWEPITADTVLNSGGLEWFYHEYKCWLKCCNRNDHTVASFFEGCGTSLIRYIGDPASEFTYTPPIEWITPTDEHVQKLGRLVCQVRDRRCDNWNNDLLIGVPFNGMFFCKSRAYLYCRVDKRLLKGFE